MQILTTPPAIGVPMILQWRVFTWRGPGQESEGSTEGPRWGPSRGRAPVGGRGKESSILQKLKQNVKLVYNFSTFLCIEILDLMNITADVGEYILQTQNTKQF